MSLTYYAAIAAGAKTFQGKPCIHGHFGERYTTSRACVDCTKHRALLAETKAKAAIKAGRSKSA